MIQRIQTLYLSGAMIACIMLFFLPLAKFDQGDKGISLLTVTGVRYLGELPVTYFRWPIYPVLAVVILSLVLILASIFLYKKRKTQILLVNTAFLAHIALILWIFFFAMSYFEKDFNVSHPSYQPGIFLPIASLLLLVLASRAIRKDEAMVRASDRLR